ncbi:MAG: phosphoesterase [Eggerthellaceae bacterium]|nr:phosphoesterase [Eggerthellaceae bacterium]
MKDIHCHIVPGVDDGSRSIEESLAMLQAAREVGVTSMICTPHCRGEKFNYRIAVEAFDAFKTASKGFPMTLGFEVAHRMLALINPKYYPKLAMKETGQFLLELDVAAGEGMYYSEYAQSIFDLQAQGFEVIIAHPERYHAIQENPDLARELIRMGCKLQASADFVAGGRLGHAKKPAKRLIKEGLYDYVASDAHCVAHYKYLKKALKAFG